MQNDWFAWLLMTEFVNNNAISPLIRQSVFFLNNGFYPRISFNSDLTKYKPTCARIETGKAEDIFKHMKRLLKENNLQDKRHNVSELKKHNHF